MHQPQNQEKKSPTGIKQKRGLGNGAGKRIQGTSVPQKTSGEPIGEPIRPVDCRLEYDPTVSMFPRKGRLLFYCNSSFPFIRLRSSSNCFEMAGNPSGGEVSPGMDAGALMPAGLPVQRHEKNGNARRGRARPVQHQHGGAGRGGGYRATPDTR
jgi:hypothetical protein